MPLTPGPFGRYDVRAFLGRGGMGEVYLAYDAELGRPLALKLLPREIASDDLRRRFRQEARAASALNHPNIVTIHEVGSEGETPYIAMELIEGMTLRQRIDRGPISVAEALEVLHQLAGALAAAEEAGIVHRDVKPENVMLRPDGLVKVLDFGLASRRVLPAPGSEGPTVVTSVVGSVVGTVVSMSPEQLRGDAVDSRSDVWSAGVLLWEMLAGVSPFLRKTTADTIAAILDEEPEAPAGVSFPAGVRALLRRMLAKDRDRRFASCAELARAVKELRDALARDSRGWSDIEAEAAPPPRRGRLPVPPTRFVGRETEAQAVRALLEDPDVRLVTLTGPGGTGKTRLALHAAGELAGELPDGVVFVALGDVTDPGLVLPSLAHELEIAEEAGTEPLTRVSAALAGRALLLVLDNFEQVLSAAPVVAALLRAAPRVKALVTSRSPLHLAGEREMPVPPLRVPDLASLPAPEELAAVPSVALFVARARALRPGFAVTDENAAAVAGICRGLDGLPLALELAAARLKVLPPKALAARLGSPLALLTGGAADLPERQRTMRAAIGWGVELLTQDQRTLFRRLAVFANGLSLEAAEAVAAGEGLGIDVLEGVASLLDNSLLRLEETAAGEPRYRMLSTIREFGLELLAESGEEEALRRRHALFFAGLAEEAERELEGGAQRAWLACLEAEHDNLRAALNWARDRGEGEVLLRLVSSLWRFWYLRGYYGEGRGWQEAALAGSAGADEALRTRALVGAGALAYLQCDYGRAGELLAESLALATSRGDARARAASLQYLGSIARELGRYEEARARHRESLSLFAVAGDERGVARSLNYVGFACWLDGALDEAEEVCRQALARFRSLGDVEGTAWALLSLSAVSRYAGDAEKATALAKESLLLSGESGYKEGTAWSLDLLGGLARQQGKGERAWPLLARSFELHRELGDRWRMASVLDALAGLAADGEDAEKGARLQGAARALRRAAGTPVPPVERPAHEDLVRRLSAALGAERFAELSLEGESTPPERLGVRAVRERGS